jgi:hypothetical protein
VEDAVDSDVAVDRAMTTVAAMEKVTTMEAAIMVTTLGTVTPREEEDVDVVKNPCISICGICSHDAHPGATPHSTTSFIHTLQTA